MKDHFARFAGRGSYICMYIYIYSYTRYIYGNGLIYSLRFFLGLHDTMVIVLFIRSRIGHLPCAALCETLFTCLWIKENDTGDLGNWFNLNRRKRGILG